MSRLCGNHLKWCCGWATGPQKCEHVETDNVEECPNYEVPTEILRHREENRKLRGAIEKKDRRLIRDRAIEIQENPNRTREWTDKESIDKAKEQLRAEGVIE